MADYMDFFNIYIMGCIQMMTGFHFFARLLHKEIKFYCYLLFAVCSIAVIHYGPDGRMAEFAAYVLMLAVSGILICHRDRMPVIPSGNMFEAAKQSFLYAALAVEIMQLCYGIVNSLLGVLYPLMFSYNQKIIGLAFMLLGNMVSLLLAGLCYHMVYRYFSYYEAIKKQYVMMVLIPILMMFFMGEYINSSLYGFSMTDDRRVIVYANHYHMLAIQLLGLASLFCILFAYKKLLQNFRLSTELSLLEQEERSLNQYVEEARAHYGKTRSFRHDIKNHIAVVKELLQKGKTEQALNYIGDMGGMAEELSFPCSTNNPVVDILAGKKLGIAESMGIDVSCSLFLPYPCGLRDIDVCIILSNALDNAIHACKNMEENEKRYIRVAGRIQGDFILMEVENSFRGNSMFKMGTGLSNIKAVAEKYHGAMSIKTEGRAFILHVLLIIPQHPEGISRQMDEPVVCKSRKNSEVSS